MTQAVNLAEFSNKLNTSGQVNATTGFSGVAPVANGATGLSTLTANNVMVGNGTGTVNFVAPGTASNVLTSNGTSWVSSAPTAFGVGQSWNIYNSSQRALSTNYTNSTGKAILVMAGVGGFPYGYVDAYVNNVFLTRQGSGASGYSQYANVTWIVQNGATYRAEPINSSWNYWAELR